LIRTANAAGATGTAVFVRRQDTTGGMKPDSGRDVGRLFLRKH
jgi:hypothetical protein